MKEAIFKFRQVEHLVRAYAKKCKYDKSFVSLELRRVLFQACIENQDSKKLKIEAHRALRKRSKYFGVVERVFQKFVGLPVHYSYLVNNFEKLGITRSDIAQELNIKMLYTIRAWGRRYAEYQQTGRYKPVSIDIFIRTALKRRVLDFFKKISNQPHSTSVVVGIPNECSNSLKIETHLTSFSLNEKKLQLNGVNLLSFCETKVEQSIVLLVVSGVKVSDVEKRYKGASEIFTNWQTKVKKVKNLIV